MLDVGLSVFTNVLRSRYRHQVDTLDLLPADGGPRGFSSQDGQPGRHYVFDLNQLERGATLSDAERYDAVLFCEVLEHLHISPRYVFPFLRDLLKPSGILVIQTPNAVTVGNRVKLVAGRNRSDSSATTRVTPCTFVSTHSGSFAASAPRQA